MNAIDDETLVAFADGELNEIQRRRVESALAADPALRERLEAQRRLRDRLSAHYGPVADEDVPEHLRAMLAGNVADLRAARERRRPRQWRDFAAIAATLVVGILIGQTALREGPSPVAVEDGTLFARGGLADALETQLASAQPGDAAVRIGVTFPADSGQICRTFESQAMDGLACRADSGWQLVMTAAGGPAGGQYRQAGSGAAAIFEAAQEIMAGEPLGPEAERRAQAAGWRLEPRRP